LGTYLARGSSFKEESVEKSESDLWHFVCDDATGHWTWKRASPTGEDVAVSSYAFASFRVCVADAERAGFDPNTTVVRRVRSSDVEVRPEPSYRDRRRRPRDLHVARDEQLD
jgi:hypothetical protein